MQPKKAIVVGATSGIGRAIVEVLTRKGWQVGIAARRQEVLQEMQSQNLNIIATECLDVTHENAAEHLNTLIGKMGGINLYFHSSGIGYQNKELDPVKELDTIAVNAMGFTRMVIAAYHYFEAHPDEEGHIAAISSIAGTKGLGAAPAYSATKRYVTHYLEALTQKKNMNGLKNLTISDIRPGFVRTPLINNDGNFYPMQLNVNDVAEEIVERLEKKQETFVVNWQYRLFVAFWKTMPRRVWVHLKVRSR